MFKAALPVVVIIALPLLVELVLRKEYTVHTKGAIVISGASSGIGKHAAIHLAKNGYTVFAGVRKTNDLDILTELAVKSKIPLIPVILDVTDINTIKTSYDQVHKYMQDHNLPLVGLVNNAGISTNRLPVELIDISKAESEFQVNYFGAIRLTQHYLPLLRQSVGRIVTVGSVAGVISITNSAVYSGTKFAVEAFNDALRRETALFGVSVSIIEPAYVKTEFLTKSQKNSPLNGLTNEQKDLYKHTLANSDQKKVKNFANADTCEVTTEAIAHALTNAYPKTRYLVAWAGPLPANVVSLLSHLLPDRLVDFLILKFF